MSKLRASREGFTNEDRRGRNGDLPVVDAWPGIQLYYPLMKCATPFGKTEDLDGARRRFRKHAYDTAAHTVIFDLEDGCRQKALSRELLRQELPLLPRKEGLQVAVRVNPFGTGEYDEDLQLIHDLNAHIDVVMLAKAGEVCGAAEIRELSSLLASLNGRLSIQPIIEHPSSFKIAGDIMRFTTVKHIVFGIHDFSKAMGIQITPGGWIEELKCFFDQLLLEARLAGKGLISGVETLIGRAALPQALVERDDVLTWLETNGDGELCLVYNHACREALMGCTGKQVIHPLQVSPCKVAYTPSPSVIDRNVAILKAAIEADVLLGGVIKFEHEMLDPPMFGRAFQILLRAKALRALSAQQDSFLLSLVRKLPSRIIRENWPYNTACRTSSAI